MRRPTPISSQDSSTRRRPDIRRTGQPPHRCEGFFPQRRGDSPRRGDAPYL